MKKRLTLAMLLFIALFANAQMVNPIQSSAQLKTNNSAEGEIIFSLKIDKGWHVYSTNLGASGPIEATIHVNKMDGVEKVGKVMARGNEISKMDNLFNMKLRYFENNAQFVQKVKFTKPKYNLDVYLEFGACNDATCMPPQEVSFKKSGTAPKFDAKAATPQEEKKVATEEQETSLPATDTTQVLPQDSVKEAAVDSSATAVGTDLWQPVIQELQAQDGRSEKNSSIWYLFIMGFAGGLLALFTPCAYGLSSL